VRSGGQQEQHLISLCCDLASIALSISCGRLIDLYGKLAPLWDSATKRISPLGSANLPASRHANFGRACADHPTLVTSVPPISLYEAVASLIAHEPMLRA